MPAFREGKIIEVIEARPDLVRIRVALPDGDE